MCTLEKRNADITWRDYPLLHTRTILKIVGLWQVQNLGLNLPQAENFKALHEKPQLVKCVYVTFITVSHLPFSNYMVHGNHFNHIATANSENDCSYIFPPYTLFE